jgi:hypothetical protein
MRVEREIFRIKFLCRFRVSSRMAPRIVFSASTFAGIPASRVRSGMVAIEEEFRLKGAFGKGGNRAGLEEKEPS